MRGARLVERLGSLCAGRLQSGGGRLATFGLSSTCQSAASDGCSTSSQRCYSEQPSPGGLSALHTKAADQGQVQAWVSHLLGADLDHIDPFGIARKEVEAISERLRLSVASEVPVLRSAAEYFFLRNAEGKRLRPTILLLLASALSGGGPCGAEFLQVDVRPPSQAVDEPRRRAQRVAEIAELIHVASLLHDDVIDEAATRRGLPSLNTSVGNKVAILAGDFLLARASVTLASLRDTRIVELMSAILEHLVSGEIMQLTASTAQLQDIDHYLRKTYCKTAALMANSSRAIAVLGAQAPPVCDLAWEYGRHLGLAFQIVDDVLDLTASSSVLGKPALSDMKGGIATAPVLLAAEEQPALRPLIERRFKRDGDVAAAMALVERSSGVARAKELAAHHAGLAARSIQALPATDCAHAVLCREALMRLTQKVLTRSK